MSTEGLFEFYTKEEGGTPIKYFGEEASGVVCLYRQNVLTGRVETLRPLTLREVELYKLIAEGKALPVLNMGQAKRKRRSKAGVNLISGSVRNLEDEHYRLHKLTHKMLADLKVTAQTCPLTTLGEIERTIDKWIQEYETRKEFFLVAPEEEL